MKDAAAHRPELCARFHRASELIGRRWTGAIIFVLLRSRCRFAVLSAAIPDITDRMLSDRLQELEEEGIIERTVVPDDARAGRVCADEERARAGGGDRCDHRLGAQVGAGRAVQDGSPGARPATLTSAQRSEASGGADR